MLSTSLSVFWPFEILLFRILCLGLCPIFIGLFVLLMSSFLSSSCILEISPLSDVGLEKIFSHSVDCYFVFLTISFALQKLLTVLIVTSHICTTGVIFWKLSPVPMNSRLLPTFSSMKFSVVGFMLRSLIHLYLYFVHGDRYGFICILLHVDILLCQHHLLKMLSFFHFIVLSSLSKIKCS